MKTPGQLEAADIYHSTLWGTPTVGGGHNTTANNSKEIDVSERNSTIELQSNQEYATSHSVLQQRTHAVTPPSPSPV